VEPSEDWATKSTALSLKESDTHALCRALPGHAGFAPTVLPVATRVAQDS
jgi:hypothetical protein